MKETVLDVLMYLFDNYFDDDRELSADHEILRTELVRAGFPNTQVTKAFDWLEGLIVERDATGLDRLRKNRATRVFATEEMERLDAECRGFLMFLDQSGFLDANERELIIDRVMALETDEIDLPQLKWIVLMVLLNQPGKDVNFTWMEDIVMEDEQYPLH